MNSDKQLGFTLIEVLFAGFILFVTIATMTSVYRGALFSSSKAEQSLELSSAVVSIRRLVSEEFRYRDSAEEPKGQGRYGDVDYRWSAKMSYKGVLPRSPDGSQPEKEFYLWDIELTLMKRSATRHYGFSEIDW